MDPVPEPDSAPPSLLDYPEDEREARARLEALFVEWTAALKEHLPPDRASLAAGLVYDGFYPHYFRQKPRILFVGRECLGLAGCDYLDVILTAYRICKTIGTNSGPRSLNRAFFHARMLHISWGILKGYADGSFPKWGDIPWATEIGTDFATETGISFAFMNLSKISNEGEGWPADWPQILAAVTASGNFIEREIELLSPHVVISMNLGDLVTGKGEVLSHVKEEHLCRYRMRFGRHECLLLDTFHFSAFTKRHVMHFYDPICVAIRNTAAEGLGFSQTPSTHPHA